MAGAYSMYCQMCGSPMSMTGMGQGYGLGYQGGYGQGFGSQPYWQGGWGGYGAGYGYGQGYMTGGIPTDDEIKTMIYDSIDADPAVPYDADITVDVTGGVVTLTGTVPNKRIKHDVGDDAWWVPGVWDINNNLNVTPRAKRAERTGGRRTT